MFRRKWFKVNYYACLYTPLPDYKFIFIDDRMLRHADVLQLYDGCKYVNVRAKTNSHTEPLPAIQWCRPSEHIGVPGQGNFWRPSLEHYYI